MSRLTVTNRARFDIIAIGIFAAIWFLGGVYFLTTFEKQQVKVIDCSLVEISPDFSPEVKEACRNARRAGV